VLDGIDVDKTNCVWFFFLNGNQNIRVTTTQHDLPSSSLSPLPAYRKEEFVMVRSTCKRTGLGVVITLLTLLLAACAGHKPEPGMVFPCADDSRIEKTIASEAELVDFSCVVKPWKGTDCLHFTIGLKNITTQPQRYKVNIFLENGKAVGGLIPRTTKKGLVEPGQTASFEYPVGGMDRAPESIILMVKTITE
jgi:hypothetical protein